MWQVEDTGGGLGGRVGMGDLVAVMSVEKASEQGSLVGKLQGWRWWLGAQHRSCGCPRIHPTLPFPESPPDILHRHLPLKPSTDTLHRHLQPTSSTDTTNTFN